MSDATLDALQGKKDEDSVWLENLLGSTTVYRSDKTKDKYEMEANGFLGSVIAMPVKVAKESFLRRAISRGKIRLLTADEATAREAELVDRGEAASETDRVMKALEKGASENSSRFTKEGLTDDGQERPGQTAQQVWASVSEKAPSQVRRSDITTVPDEGPIEAIIEEPVREGDPNFRSDTGL